MGLKAASNKQCSCDSNGEGACWQGITGVGAVSVQALTRVNPAVYESVAALAADPASAVIIFSGSDKVCPAMQPLSTVWSGSCNVSPTVRHTAYIVHEAGSGLGIRCIGYGPWLSKHYLARCLSAL